MEWLNEPAAWQHEGGALVLTSNARTDFWRKTYNGEVRDSGHFYGQRVEGDFTAEVKVSGEYSALYDQAGLMLRQDDARWIKCGIEFVENVQYVSAVVTRDTSDWSICPLVPGPASLWLRVRRYGSTVEVHYSTDGAAYRMLRQTTFTDAPVLVGPMIASPTGEGFTARFEGFEVTP